MRALVSSLEASYPGLSRFYEIAETLELHYIPTRYPDALPSGAPFEVYMYEDGEEALHGAERIYNLGREIILH